jgi:retron-type reverse transcriptase
LANPNAFNLLQLNINGLKGKANELNIFLRDNNIKIAALQETKLDPLSPSPTFKNYTVIRKDRNQYGGGVAFLVHHSIQYHNLNNPLPNDPHLEALAIEIPTPDGNTTITNIYLPPTSSCQPNYQPPFSSLLQGDNHLILGDFNAHHKLWYSSLSDPRGNLLCDDIASSHFGVLNENSPTRAPPGGPSTSPDITLATPNLLLNADWVTITSLSSDHLPIIVTLTNTSPFSTSPKITFTNFAKANWDKFTSESEAQFANLPLPTPSHSSAPKLEKQFRTILLNAAKHSIPSGRIPIHTPCITTQIKTLIDERDHLRTTNAPPDLITTKTETINKLIDQNKSEKYQKYISNIDPRKGTKGLWRVIKSLNGKSTPPTHCSINFRGNPEHRPKSIAKKLNKMFTQTLPYSSNRNTRNVIRKVNSLKGEQISFSPSEVSIAVTKLNSSKAVGPDKLTALHIKHLGTRGIEVLTRIINDSLSYNAIPSIWKTSNIIPYSKPGKDPCQASSYRPISLLSPAAKVIEKLVLPFITEHLPPASHQHGFRPNHSTTSALTNLSNHIISGFNQKRPPHRTVMVALDLTKAFDTVDHLTLINILIRSTLPPTIIKWLTSYLRGRKAYTTYKDQISTQDAIHFGVPQGSIISPALFNAYIRDIPDPPPNIHIISYADDITIFSSGTNIPQITEQLNTYLATLSQFLNDRQLIISPQKSSVTLFTPDNAQLNCHPQVTINGNLLPLEKTPKILGVTFDPKLTFGIHTINTTTKIHKRNNVLKALSGSSWGQSKETITSTYKTIGRSIANYAAPVWCPNLSNTNFKKIQVAQNSALRTATGCLKMTPIDHLHQETQILPILNHSNLLCTQYLAKCTDPIHPCHTTIMNSTRPRPMKHTLLSKYSETLNSSTHHLPPNATVKDKLRSIHTTIVEETLDSFQPNRLLDTRPPTISKTELSLPRGPRSILSQLRSGFCSKLNSFQNRIKPNVPNSCPSCNHSPHDVIHLFNCPSNPNTTNLQVQDLWTNPLPTFNFLHL